MINKKIGSVLVLPFIFSSLNAGVIVINENKKSDDAPIEIVVKNNKVLKSPDEKIENKTVSLDELEKLKNPPKTNLFEEEDILITSEPQVKEKDIFEHLKEKPKAVLSEEPQGENNLKDDNKTLIEDSNKEDISANIGKIEAAPSEVENKTTTNHGKDEKQENQTKTKKQGSAVVKVSVETPTTDEVEECVEFDEDEADEKTIKKIDIFEEAKGLSAFPEKKEKKTKPIDEGFAELDFFKLMNSIYLNWDALKEQSVLDKNINILISKSKSIEFIDTDFFERDVLIKDKEIFHKILKELTKYKDGIIHEN